jgi:hypothetical protein
MTRDTELPLHRLLGRPVLDADGRSIGRIEEIHAEPRNGELVVTEWVLGAGGLLERLGLVAMARVLLGWPPVRAPEVLDWAELDLADPERPRRRPGARTEDGHPPTAARR